MPSLVVSYSDLLDQIGRKVGWGYPSSAWSSDTTKLADAQRFIASGLRRFYFPMVEGQGKHVWSFLMPLASLTMTNATNTYQLPSDFVELKTGFTFAQASVRLARKPEAELREMIRANDRIGLPEYYAVRLKSQSDGAEPAYEVLFWPRPDAAYELAYRYVKSPPTVTSENPYHLGGAQHSETVLAAVLSAAEEHLDDEPQVHSAQFQRLLISSVALDRELSDDEGDGEDTWEATSTLKRQEIDVAYLRRLVGRELGFGPNPNTWTRRQVEEVQLSIESGYRRFCNPPPGIVEDRPRHIWSFMTPTDRVVAMSGNTEVLLPEGFTELASEAVSFVGESTRSAVRVGQDSVRRLRADASLTGAPKYVAVRVTNVDGVAGTRYEMMLYPTPDRQYTLEFRYLLMPPALSDEHPVPLGGAQHAETIVAACLAAAESIKGVRDGQRETEFRALLASSIVRDAELAEPNEDEIWPVVDESQTLTINRGYLKRLTGRLAGFSPHQSLWTHSQQKQVEAILEIGLRKFYNPVTLPGERYSYEWSFLRPIGSIYTVANQYEYDLPEDFALMCGPLTYSPSEGGIYPAVQVYGEEQVRMRRQIGDSTTGRPCMAAVVPKNAGADGQTSYRLTLWPTPADGYTLSFRYQVSPDSLSDDTELPVGGSVHAQTVLEACLSAVEEFQGQSNGPHSQRFIERLRASVSHDRMLNAPETLGYDRDRSDAGGLLDNWHEYADNTVQYKGQTW